MGIIKLYIMKTFIATALVTACMAVRL